MNKPDRRLLVLSSPDPNGDQDGPPDIATASSGPLLAVREVRDSGAWPDDIDLLILSDAYGLVEPDSPAGWPVPIPFFRVENPDWWAGFITRNLDNLLGRRAYSAAYAMPDPAHEPAVRASQKLRDLSPTWGIPTGDAPSALLAWITGEPEPEPAPEPRKRTSRRSSASRSKLESSAPASLPDPPLSPAQTLAAGIVQSSIYSNRFILAISKMSGEELDEVRRELSFEWSRRATRRYETPSVSNFVMRSARLPWSDRPAITLYGRLLESFGMANVLGSINKAVTQLAITEPGRYREILARMPKDESEFMTDLLHLLWEASSRMDKDEISLLRAYLSDSCTHAELRRLGLSRNLYLEDRYEILRSVVSCLVGLAPFGEISDYRRVFIRLDEIENIVGYPQHERRELVKALNTLLGDSPQCVTVWLNISPRSVVRAADIQAALENNLVITDDLTQ